MATRSWVVGAVLGGLTAGTVATAAASTIEEVAHEVTVELEARQATVVVRRTLATDWSDHHEGHLEVRAREPMAATGLRTRGDDGRWYAAEVLPVEAAIATYWQLTGSEKVAPERGGQRFPQMSPRDPALMLWGQDGFDVYVFPVAQGRPRTVEYTLTAPYAYRGGAHEVTVPVGEDHELAPRVKIARVARGHRAFVGATEVKAGSVIAATGAEGLVVRMVATSQPELTVRVASTRAGSRQVARLEVEAGTRLGPDPKDTRVVVVLDRSRSLGESGAEATRAAALAYLTELERVPGARAAVIGFDRKVERVVGEFVRPAEAAAAVQALSDERANGSDLAGALREAAGLLARVGGPRRVLVLSDSAVAPVDDAAVRAALAGSAAVVHVADLEGGRVSTLEVDEAYRWESEVRATGGQVWRGTVDDAGDSGSLFAEWVRPQQVRGLRVRRDGSPVTEMDLPGGEGVAEVVVLDVAPGSVQATGWLWGRPIVREGRRTRQEDAAWTVLAAAYLDDALTDTEVADVATRAHAVSPRTALLALEPGAEAGQAEPPGEATLTSRGLGCSAQFGNPHSLGRTSLAFDEQAFVREAVSEAAAACAARGTISAEVTTSYAEVVRVDGVAVTEEPAAANCVRDRLWALEFPPGRRRVVEHFVTVER